MTSLFSVGHVIELELLNLKMLLKSDVYKSYNDNRHYAIIRGPTFLFFVKVENFFWKKYSNRNNKKTVKTQ